MIIMKNILDKIKEKLPKFKDKIISSIDVILIYQGFLFVISPTPINQLLFIGAIIIFILDFLKKI